MLSACYSTMDPERFQALPNSTNAVESYNRFPKAVHPEILKVTLMSAYREDMAKAIAVMAQQRGLATTYEKLSLSARLNRSTQQNSARRKRLQCEDEDEASGPPDTKRKFGGETVKQSQTDLMYSSSFATQ